MAATQQVGKKREQESLKLFVLNLEGPDCDPSMGITRHKAWCQAIPGDSTRRRAGGVGNGILLHASPHGCSSMQGDECKPDDTGAATAVSGATTNQAVTQSGSCSLLRQLSYCSTLAAKPQVMLEECANITVGEKLWKAKLICLSPPPTPRLPWIHMFGYSL